VDENCSSKVKAGHNKAKVKALSGKAKAMGFKAKDTEKFGLKAKAKN